MEGAAARTAAPSPTTSDSLTRAEVRTCRRIRSHIRRRSRCHGLQHLHVALRYVDGGHAVAAIHGRLRRLDELPIRVFVPWPTRRIVASRHVVVHTRVLRHARELALRKVWLDRMQ